MAVSLSVLEGIVTEMVKLEHTRLSCAGVVDPLMPS